MNGRLGVKALSSDCGKFVNVQNAFHERLTVFGFLTVCSYLTNFVADTKNGDVCRSHLAEL